MTAWRACRLRFSTIEDGLLRRALETGATIEGYLPLTSARGGPICAAVKPPVLRWEVASG